MATAVSEAAPPATDAPAILRLVMAGSVDDGKSTLIGRLLHDSRQIAVDQLQALRDASERRHGPGSMDLSLLTDGLRAEREQGITIDVAYRYFATPRRRFIIADTPGHEQYTRNMVTGASTADVALILVDVRSGVVKQTRRHAFLASLLGIRHLVVCVNKMDLVSFRQGPFDLVERDFREFSARLDTTDVTFIPICALEGDNVVERSRAMPWYEGPALLYHLEHVHVASDRNLIDCRMPVQWVIRAGQGSSKPGYRGYAGQIAAGVLRPGDPVLVLPSGAESRIEAIDTADGPLAEAFAPMSVTLRLAHDVDVSRGDMICRPHNRPTVGRELEAVVCWMGERPLAERAQVLVKHTTRTVRACVQRVRYRIDVDTLRRDEDARLLSLNDIGRVRLLTSAPLIFDEYRRNRTTGSLILIDEATNQTVAAAMIIEPHIPPATTARDITWHDGRLTRDARWSMIRHRGATIWLTGLSAAGKSTIASALEARIAGMGQPAYLLDGDNLRHGLNSDLGFSAEDRAENVRRVAEVARLFADAGTIAIVALISPFRADRLLARSIHERAGVPFLEVYVNTTLGECERRDPKGLYARARRGLIPDFTGIASPYEPPTSPDVELLTERCGVEQLVEQLVGEMRARGVLERAPRAGNGGG